jgi:hypothetical protein
VTEGVPVGSIDDLEAVLDGAGLLGLELDTRYRVLAVTLEPSRERYPWGSGSDSVVVVDRRVQLLCSPVSVVLGSLRRHRELGRRTEVYTFSEDQLVEVSGAFDGAAVSGPLFGRPEPRPGSWAPRWSLEGRSTAGDGIAHTLTVSVRRPDDDGRLELDLFVRFDELRVRDARGVERFTTAPAGAGPLDLWPDGHV